MKLLVFLCLFTFMNVIAAGVDGDMSNKQKLVLVKQQVGSSSIKVGLKAVPEFYQGSIENYCQDLASKLVENPSMVTFKPIEGGKVFTAVSLLNGSVTFQPLTDEHGLQETDWFEAFIKAN